MEKYVCTTGLYLIIYIKCILYVILFAIISVILSSYIMSDETLWKLMGMYWVLIYVGIMVSIPIMLMIVASGPILDMIY